MVHLEVANFGKNILYVLPKLALHEKWFLQRFDSSLRISVISAYYSSEKYLTQRSQRYAEIAKKTSSHYKDYFSCKAT